MATKQEWTEIAEDNFLEMWRERPCLFDTSIKAFSHRNTKRVALEEMSFRLGKSVNDINKKMKNMRTQFSRILKAPPSGSGRHGLTLHQQWIVTNLEFLRPYMKSKETQSSFKLESNSQYDEDEENGLLSSDDEISRTCASPIPSYSSFKVEVRSGTSSPTCSVSSKEFNPPNPPATENSRVNPGSTERAADLLNRENMAVLNSIAESITKPLSLPDMEEERMDEDGVFGQYVASRLRKIKNQRTKTRLIAVINNAISEAELSIFSERLSKTQKRRRVGHVNGL